LFFLIPFLLSGNPLHALYPQVFSPSDLLQGYLVSLLLVGACNEDSLSLHKETEETVRLRLERVQLRSFLVA
jgi:hypothetical protein